MLLLDFVGCVLGSPKRCLPATPYTSASSENPTPWPTIRICFHLGNCVIPKSATKWCSRPPAPRGSATRGVVCSPTWRWTITRSAPKAALDSSSSVARTCTPAHSRRHCSCRSSTTTTKLARCLKLPTPCIAMARSSPSNCGIRACAGFLPINKPPVSTPTPPGTRSVLAKCRWENSPGPQPPKHWMRRKSKTFWPLMDRLLHAPWRQVWMAWNCICRTAICLGSFSPRCTTSARTAGVVRTKTVCASPAKRSPACAPPSAASHFWAIALTPLLFGRAI